jgi:outer membrane protein TolC
MPVRIALTLLASCALLGAQLPGMSRPAAPADSGMAPSMGTPVSPQSGLRGSVPSGDVTPGVLNLSLREALDRALKYNLALVETGESIQVRRAQRMLALSQLIPTLTVRPSVTGEQINLLAFGFPLPPGTPGVVGPFTVYDARAYGTSNLSFQSWRNYRSGGQAVRAEELSLRDARDQVVQIVIQLSLQTITASARIDAARARVRTAERLYQQALDRRNAGTAPGIDVLRAQVEAQAERQRLIAYEGDFDKQKLALGRAIGLPAGQPFRTTETVPYAPLPAGVTLEESLGKAFEQRSDYRAADALVHASQLALSAARAARLPSLSLNADYGVIGPGVTRAHGTFSVSAAANIPVFEGGRIRANIALAESQLRQRTAEREDLRGRIDAEVRAAFLDVRTAERQVEVARNNLELAQKTLEQAQDRFNAGVTNNLEVVQAQEAVATAEESLIASRYAYNSAKTALLRARGEPEASIARYLSGK